jgi:Uma2 family endonuclease
MAITQQGLTLEQFLALPEEKPALEYVDGDVCQKMSPKGEHSGIQVALIELINGFARSRKLGLAFSELRTTYGGRSFVPDVAIYRWERIPRSERGRIVSNFTEPPDATIEIVSPGQSPNSLTRRCLLFLAEGVRIALLIDPYDESIVDFRPGAEPRVLRGADLIDLADVVPGLGFTVAELFDLLTIQ